MPAAYSHYMWYTGDTVTFQIALLLGILIVGAIIFISEKWRPDVTALVIMITLGLTGLVTPAQSYSGLSSSSVVVLIAVFIMTGALFRTGVSGVIGRSLVRAAGQSEIRLIALVTIAAAGLSLIMNNIASAAVLMPAVMDATRRTKISPSKLLLPMAFATQLGGMATLFTTSNLVASGALQNAGLQGFGLFDFLSVGGLAALAAMIYLITIGRRALPDKRPILEMQHQEKIRDDLFGLYQIKERLYEIRPKATSRLIGQALKDSDIGDRLGLTVLAIERNGQTLLAPAAAEIIHKNDVLLIEGREERINQLNEWDVQIDLVTKWPGTVTSKDIELLEILVAPRSRAIGQSLKQLHFRNKYGLNVVALWRRGRSYRTGFSDFELEGGDALLVHGQPDRFKILQAESEWIVLRLEGLDPLRSNKMPLALLILVASLIISAIGIWPVSLTLMIGALAMVLTNCLSMDEAYQSIDWRSVFLVGGMLPIGIALKNTGGAALLGTTIVQLTNGLGPLGTVAGLFLVTTVLNQFIPGGSAVPAVLAPIAIAAAEHLGTDPRAFALVVAIATGTSLLTPFAHPVNVLVMGPGGYRFRDYLRVGLPLVIIVFLVVMIALPLFWHIG